MGRKCVICKVTYVKSSEKTFHKFPADEVKKALWMKSLRLKWSLPSYTVCSDHFDSENFSAKGLLKKDAVPTRNLDSPGLPANNSVDCCTPANADVLTATVDELTKTKVTTKKCDNYCLNKRFKSFSRFLNDKNCSVQLNVCNSKETDVHQRSKICSNHVERIYFKDATKILEKSTVPTIFNLENINSNSLTNKKIYIVKNPSTKAAGNKGTTIPTALDSSELSPSTTATNTKTNTNTIVRTTAPIVLVSSGRIPSSIDAFNNKVTTTTPSVLNSSEKSPSTPTAHVSQKIARPVLKTPTRKKTIRYIGDIKSTDLETPKTAKLHFQMARAKIEKQRKIIKTLKRTVLRLQNKLSLLEFPLNHLPKKTKPTTSTNIHSNHKETGQINSSAKYSRIRTDHNYCGSNEVISGEKKRKIFNQRKCFQVLRNRISKEWKIPCSHKNSAPNICMVSVLTNIDIELFRKKLWDFNKKIDQDKFLLTMMTVKRPKNTNKSKRIRQERTVVYYFIPEEKGDLIRVCLNAFVGISSITRKRLNILALNFKNTHTSPMESKEGFSSSKKVKSYDLADSIKNNLPSTTQ